MSNKTKNSASSHYLMRHATLQNTVPGDLTHVAGAELEDLGCDGILLHQGLLWTSRTIVIKTTEQLTLCTSKFCMLYI